MRSRLSTVLIGSLAMLSLDAAAIEPKECPLWFPDFRCERSGRYEGFVAPIASPYLFEDPFITTNLQAVGIFHQYPGDSVFDGGHAWVVAVQARLAITDRLAFIATKDGYVFHRPETPALSDDEGFFDIAAGFKYALIDMREKNFILSPSLRFDIPVGNQVVYSGNGDGVIIPAVSAAWGIDRFHVMGDFGARLPFNMDKESTSIFYHLHLSYGLFKHFVPVFELSGYHWTGSGDGTRLIQLTGVPGNPKLPLSVVQAVTGTGPFEGADVVNLGSSGVGGNNLVTLSLGARIPVVKHVSLGAAYEFPVTSRRDVFDQRATLNVMLEF